MSADLTHMQAAVLAFVRKHIAEHQCPPTRAEISQHFGWASANAAETHLQALERKGAVQLRGKARGIFVMSMETPA